MEKLRVKKINLASGSTFEDIILDIENEKILHENIKSGKVILGNWFGIEIRINCSQIVYYEV